MVTMKEARKRWNEHTKHVLSNIGRACAKNKTVFDMVDFGSRDGGLSPCVFLGENAAIRIRFVRDDSGTIHGQSW